MLYYNLCVSSQNHKSSSVQSDPSLPVLIPRGRDELHTLSPEEGFLNPTLSGLKKEKQKIFTYSTQILELLSTILSSLLTRILGSGSTLVLK